MLRTAFLLTLLFSIHSSFAATVYKYLDENGNLVFTDEPRKGAEKLDVQPVPTIPAIPVPKPTDTTQPDKAFHYNKIVIVSPEDQKNFINEVEPIVVQAALSPGLRSSDRLQLMLNGAPKGSPISSSQFTLEGLDRGEYQAMVKVIDKDGAEVGASAAVSFFVKRNSKLMPKPAKPTPVKPKPAK